MHPGALRALEFDRIVAAVRSFALTPSGAARLEALHPDTEPARVREALLATSETVRYLADNAVFPLRATDDLPELLDLLTVEGRALESLRLLTLADYLESVETSAAAIRRASGEFPRLRQVAAIAASFRVEIADVRHRIAPSGDVQDHASPRLASIRDQLRKKRSRLRETLDGYLRGKDTSKYLQDQIITERNGRFVLLVKAEHRSSLPGLVHGSSSSGATLYLEPLSTIDINNDVVALESDQAEEVQRILLELTDRFRTRSDDVARTEGVATALDVLQAKARFAEVTGAVAPALSADGRLELLGARHPLLMKRRGLALYGRSFRPAGSADTCRHQSNTARYDTARHGTEHGRQNSGAQDGGASAAHGPGGSACACGSGLGDSGVSVDLRRHRRRAVDRGEPQHVRVAHHEHRIDGSRSGVAGAGAAGRNRRGHRSHRGRRPRGGHSRPLSHAWSDRDRHDPLRRTENVCVDDSRRRIGGVRVRSGRVRPDLSPGVRIAGSKPGARNGEPARSESPHRRSGARGARHARTAVGHSARANGSRSCAPGRGPEGRGRRARRAGAGKGTGRTSRRGITGARERLQAKAERSCRGARACRYA